MVIVTFDLLFIWECDTVRSCRRERKGLLYSFLVSLIGIILFFLVFAISSNSEYNDEYDYDEYNAQYTYNLSEL